MTNAQAALIAAASQVDSRREVEVTDEVGNRTVDGQTATLLLARHYQTWLDRQDELTKKLPGGDA